MEEDKRAEGLIVLPRKKCIGNVSTVGSLRIPPPPPRKNRRNATVMRYSEVHKYVLVEKKVKAKTVI